MSLLSISHLTIDRGAKLLVSDASFSIHNHEKVALIGRNGSGKSTVLATINDGIASKAEPIVIQRGARISYLAQNPAFNRDHTIEEHLLSGDDPVVAAIRDYHRVAAGVSSGSHSIDDLDAISTTMTALNAWSYESTVQSLLTELGITDWHIPMTQLSGGMAKKVELARLFFVDADLILLDEPTNHLDVETIVWLEEKLKAFQGSVVMVTHDRYFLERVCDRILEIDHQTIRSYPGAYHAYMDAKLAEASLQKAAQQRFDNMMRRELAWLRQGAKARSTKQKARKDRIESMAKQPSFAAPNELALHVAKRRLGNKILECVGITKQFDRRSIITSFDFMFQRGHKVGIAGLNGVGKTTLVNLLSGSLPPDSGTVDVGQNTVFGILGQHADFENSKATVLEFVQAIGHQLTLHDGQSVNALQLLDRFLFPKALIAVPIADLSGGEKRRLQLVTMLLKNPNFLILDEPTNDFDIATLSILEDFIINFDGCVVVISHDRFFMDRVVEHLLILDGTGQVHVSEERYSDAVSQLIGRSRPLMAPRIQESTEPSSIRSSSTAPAKLSFKEQREFQKLEHDITAWEAEKITLTDQLNAGDNLHVTGQRLADIDQQLAEAYARWEVLAERA
ncbi:ABC transporter ATP-binding protein [bacterium]|nr:ABC transporter ATP-binding protein [bacterium]